MTARGVGLRERRELDDLVTIAAVLGPIRRGARASPDARDTRARIGADKYSTRYPRRSSASSCAKCRSSKTSTIGPRGDPCGSERSEPSESGGGGGALKCSGDVCGVGLEKALDDGAPKVSQLLRIALHRLDQRRVEELQIEELPEEIDDVADFAILEHRRGLRAHLRLRGFGVHALDDAEARAEDAPEDAVRGP